MQRVSDFMTHETKVEYKTVSVFNCPNCQGEMDKPKDGKHVSCPHCGQRMIGWPSGRLSLVSWDIRLLASDYRTPSGLFVCPTCGAGQSKKSHGEKDNCVCCGQGMIRYGNALFLIGKRKHFWSALECKRVDNERVAFGRYSIKLSFWLDKWHALITGPVSQMNGDIVEHVLLSDRDRDLVSLLALDWLYKNVG